MGHVRITLALLKKLYACEGQRDIFRRTFPRGVTLTPEVPDAIINKVVKSTLDFDWLARDVLTDPACVEYRRVCDAALAKYWSACDAALAEYRRVRDAVDGERVRDAAWSEYERVRAAALAKCRRACVRAAWAALADRNNWNPGILA